MADEHAVLAEMEDKVRWCEKKIEDRLQFTDQPGYNELLLRYAMICRSNYDRQSLMVRRHRKGRALLNAKLKSRQKQLANKQAHLTRVSGHTQHQVKLTIERLESEIQDLEAQRDEQ